MSERKNLPVVYSCSGCSSAAQLANHIAIRLDRKGVAEMSCIAGVGGDVPALVRVARSGRPIIAIDGCHLKCAHACLKRHDITPAHSFTLSDFDIKKEFHKDFSEMDANAVLDSIEKALTTFFGSES